MSEYSTKKKLVMGRFRLSFLMVLVSALLVFLFQIFIHEIASKPILEKNAGINLNEGIIINFSLPVKTASIENSFSVLPSQKALFKWENGNRRVVITPQTFWKTETLYAIKINNGKDILFRSINEEFNFETKHFPAIISFEPIAGEKNVAVAFEDPVRIKFNSSVEEYNVKFVISPDAEFDWQLNEDKTEIILLSKNDLKWSTQYRIGVFIKDKQDSADEYRKIGETFFDTASPPAPAVWDIDPKIRAEQARNFTEAKLKDGKYIDINLSKQVMVIFENAIPLDAYIISSGKRGMETPKGSFSIKNKASRVWSKKYSLFMPFWMAIVPSGEVGIHELPEWPGGYKEGANHLGTPVSHGCVRLGVGSAKRVYDWAEIGTPVVVY